MLEQFGIPCRTFYRWYDRYLVARPEASEDRPSVPSRVWNRVPANIHDQIIEPAPEQSELSPRELAVHLTDEKRYFVSEARFEANSEPVTFTNMPRAPRAPSPTRPQPIEEHRY